MTNRKTLVLVIVCVVAVWGAAFDLPDRGLGSSSTPGAKPMNATRVEPVEVERRAQWKRTPDLPVAPPEPALVRSHSLARAVNSAAPEVSLGATLDGAPLAPGDSIQEAELEMFSAAREVALLKVERHIKSEPQDDARSEQLSDQYNARIGDPKRGAQIAFQVSCSAAMCLTTVETGDWEVLAALEELHVELGLKAMTTSEGEPEQGIVRSVSYYLADPASFTSIVGPSSDGVFAPGRTESAEIATAAQQLAPE